MNTCTISGRLARNAFVNGKERKLLKFRVMAKHSYKKGEDVIEIPSVNFRRRYKKDGEWKSTSKLGMNDIPKAIHVLKKAFEYIIDMKRKSEKKG